MSFWQKTSTGRYERDADANEVFLKTVAETSAPFNRAHWTINTIAHLEVDVPDVEDALAQAWRRTRHRAPFIACLIKNGRLIYEVPDQASQDKWLKESFFVEKGTVDQFLLDARPRIYSSLHYFSASSQVVMRLQHWLADGVGSLAVLDILLDNLAEGSTTATEMLVIICGSLFVETQPTLRVLLTLSAAPSFGDEWQRLPPSHHQANGFPDVPSADAEAYADKLFMDFVTKLPSVGLPIELPQGQFHLGGTKKISKSFDKTTSEAVATACKRHGVTVSSALHAALINTTHKNATPETKGRDYTWIAAFNYRPYLPAPYNDTKIWPTGAYIIGPPVNIPEAGFIAQAQGMQKHYHQPLRKGETLLFDAYETYNKKLLAAFATPPPPDMPLPTSPEMSCLGKLDKFVKAEHFGKYQVKLLDVEIAVDQITPNIISYSWSFKGRLGLSLVYNEAMYKDSYVQDFFEKMQNTISQGLSVELPQ